MSQFASQITFTHVGHLATETAHASPRHAAQQRYRALTGAAAHTQRPMTARAAGWQASAGSSLNVLTFNGRDKSAWVRPQSAAVTGAVADGRSPRHHGHRADGATTSHHAPAPPDSSRRPPPVRSTYASLMGTTSLEAQRPGGAYSTTRLQRERALRHDMMQRQFHGHIFETTRSLRALIDAAEEASKLPPVPQPPVPPPAPYLHGLQSGAAGGDGTGVGGPYELLPHPPGKRHGPLQRLMLASAAELRALKAARAEIVSPRSAR
jgi:hypothetical protein